MKNIPLAFVVVVALICAPVLAQPATPPCTPGKVCRPASVYTPGDVTSLGSLRTYDSSNLVNNWRQSTYNGTTSFEQNGGAVYACGVGTTTCTYAYDLATSTITNKSVISSNYLRSIGAAFASFPTCNGGIAGAILYDQTNNCEKICNGTGWSVCVQPASYINNYWSAMCIGAPCAEVASFTGGIYSLGGSVTRATCSWGNIGTAGGADTVVVKIRNTTAGSDLCSCTIGSCAIAINTPTSCSCAGTFTAGSLYTWQLDAATDCAVNPGNIICTASVIP